MAISPNSRFELCIVLNLPLIHFHQKLEWWLGVNQHSFAWLLHLFFLWKPHTFTDCSYNSSIEYKVIWKLLVNVVDVFTDAWAFSKSKAVCQKCDFYHTNPKWLIPLCFSFWAKPVGYRNGLSYVICLKPKKNGQKSSINLSSFNRVWSTSFPQDHLYSMVMSGFYKPNHSLQLHPQQSTW